MLLPLIGAGLGAYQGYQEGGLGGAALGAGLGAVTPLGLRMAGTALGARLGAGALGRASGALGEKALAANLAARELGTEGLKGVAGQAALSGSRGLGALAEKIATPAGIGALTAGIGTLALGAPGLAGSLAGKTAQALIPKATSAVGKGRMIQGVFDSATGEFTPMGTDPALGMPRTARTASEMLNPQGYEMGALELQRRMQDVGLEGAGKFMNLERSYLDEAKTRDLARSAAAARLANDLATQQGLTMGGQRIAGAMSTQALGDVGAGLRTQYRYL